MPKARWYIQVVESFPGLREADRCLKSLFLQEGYCGGRLLEPSPTNPDWRVQAFMQDEPEAGEFPGNLPDGCRRVIVPEFLRRRLGIGDGC